MCRVADIFAQMNNKMSGDLKKIQVTGKYFVEIWKAIGMEGIDDKVSWLCMATMLRLWEASHGPNFAIKSCPHHMQCPRGPRSHTHSHLQVLFLNASEEINSNPHEYNALMLNIARSFNLNRIRKCTQIMGREESDDLSAAQIFYPCMQCADIFFLKVNLAFILLEGLHMPPIGFADVVDNSYW